MDREEMMKKIERIKKLQTYEERARARLKLCEEIENAKR